ncbi:MAG TPA: argininosuccinate lyase [Methanocorpusculum sp.]|nr:argininosuccinate lyase [Methanocorpusculum sp.]
MILKRERSKAKGLATAGVTMTGTDQIRKGRLDGKRGSAVSEYLSSAAADRHIAYCDLRVDMAHILMLAKQNLIDPASAKVLLSRLHRYMNEGLSEEVFDPVHEDIHAGIEAQLIADCGVDIGGKMHLGRSRNDEVATCLRMQTRLDVLKILDGITALRHTLLDQAVQHTHSIMPGFTHSQHAQPTTLAHYLLAYEAVFTRDAGRLFDAYVRLNVSPLGSAAFAGTGFAIDSEATAAYLGFPSVMTNSMDGVASRDFMLEVLAALSILMTNISRLCEELVLWSSAFIRFVELDDAYCSTSSIMPQKKNPDTAEIMRGKSGVASGELMAGLTLMKGLPMSYNRDMQDLTPHLWRSLGAAEVSLSILAGMIRTASFNTERMAEESGRGNATATELADLMVREFKMPFRTAHNIVGRAVKLGGLSLDIVEVAGTEVYGRSLKQLGLTQEHIDCALSPSEMVAAKQSAGAPNPAMMAAAADAAGALLVRDEKRAETLRSELARADDSIKADYMRLTHDIF